MKLRLLSSMLATGMNTSSKPVALPEANGGSVTAAATAAPLSMASSAVQRRILSTVAVCSFVGVP